MSLSNILSALAITLHKADIALLIIILVVVAGIVTFYFLQPVIRKKEFEEQRANFAKREETFRENLKVLQGEKENTKEIEQNDEK